MQLRSVLVLFFSQLLFVFVFATADVVQQIDGQDTKVSSFGKYIHQSPNHKPHLTVKDFKAFSQTRTTRSVEQAAFHSGAVIKVDDRGEGQFVVTQLDLLNSLPQPVAGVDDRVELSWSFGPVSMNGYVVKTTLETGVELKVLGIQIGHFYGNLKDGMAIKLNLFLSAGEIRLYLKNGHEVWVHVDVKVKFDGAFNKDVKLVSL